MNKSMKIQPRKISLSTKILAYTLAGLQAVFSGGVAWALPMNGTIVNGTGHISTSGNTMTIKQTSKTLTTNWQTFNINSGQVVKFIQPNSTSVAINDILGNSASKILGEISANGQVWLLNPNGVLFGTGSIINTRGFLASTLQLVQNSGSSVSLSGTSKNSVINNGTMSGDYVALVGNNVSNTGNISGKIVMLVGGSDVTLKGLNGGTIGFVVNKSTLDNMASNSGLIEANGGYVALAAGAKDSLLSSAVNNSGVIEANTVSDQSGQIVLLSGLSKGTTTVGGSLLAEAPNGGNGGTIETSGSRVNILPTSVVSTSAASGQDGTWTLDPASFYIGENTGTANSTAGNLLNYEDMSGTLLANDLAVNNIIIDSTFGTAGALGNVYINDPISYNSANYLKINAVTNVNVNQNITNAGTGPIILRADDMNIGGIANPNVGYVSNGINDTGFNGVPSGIGTVNIAQGVSVSTGGYLNIFTNPTNGYFVALTNPVTGTAYVNGNSSGTIIAYDLISSNNDLYFIDANTRNVNSSVVLKNNYALNTDLALPSPQSTSLSAPDLLQVQTATGSYGNSYQSGSSTNSNWLSIGGLNNPYTGTFDGLEHTISGINSQSPNTSTFLGFIGNYSGLLVDNLGIVNETLFGQITTYGGGYGGIGGIVSVANSGYLTNLWSSGTFTESPVNSGSGVAIGGIVGNIGNVAGLSNASSSANIISTYTGTNNSSVGGLVGVNQGTVSTSHASGAVSGEGMLGGLVGYNDGGTLNFDYATGNISVQSSPNYSTGGGLVGSNLGSVYNSYAIGNVTNASGWADIGGLEGIQPGSTAGTTTEGAYATGNVTQNGSRGSEGGLMGHLGGTVVNDYATGNILDTSSSTLDYETPAGGLGGWIGHSYLSYDYSTGLVTYTGPLSMQYSGIGNFLGYNGWHNSSYVYLSNLGYNSTVNTTYPAQGGPSSSWSVMVGGVPESSFSDPAWSSGSVPNGVATWTPNTSGTLSNNYEWVEGTLYSNGTSFTAPLLTKLMGIENVSINQIQYNYTGVANAQTPTVSITNTMGAANLNGSGMTIGGPGTSATNVGAYNITASGIAPAQTLNQYSTVGVNYTPGAVLINPAKVTVGNITANNKTYTGTTTATLSNNGTLTGLQNGQTLTLNAPTSVNFTDPNVGTALSVDANGYSLSNGTGLASNYVLTNTNYVTTANITPAPLSLSTSASKVYDGNGTIGLSSSNSSISGIVSGQTGDITSITGTLNSANVGTDLGGNTSLANGDFSGNSNFLNALALNDYTLPTTFTGGAITPAPLSVTGTVASSRQYNGTTLDSLSGATLSGLVSGASAPTLSNDTTGTLSNNGNAGTDSVTTNMSLTGTNSQDYTLSQPTGISAVITKAPLAVSGVNTTSRQYNGTTSDVLSGAVISGNTYGNSLSLTNDTTGVLSNNGNAGVDSVSTNIGLTGTGASNFTLSQEPGLSAIISKAGLTVSGTQTTNRIYNGTTIDSLSGSTLSGTIFNGTDPSLTNNGEGILSNNGNAGLDNVTTAFGLTGIGSSNYFLTQPTGLTATINPAPLAVSGTVASNRTYNGSNIDSLTGSVLTGTIYNGQSITLNNAGVGVLSNNGNAGIDSVTTSMSLGGTNSQDYMLSQPTGVTADISKANLVGKTSVSKVYDGTTLASLNSSNTEFQGVAGQTGTLVPGVSGQFFTPNVGKNIGVTTKFTDSELTGENGFISSNYNLPTEIKGGSITPAPLTLSNGGVKNLVSQYTGGKGVTLTTKDSFATLSGFVPGQGAIYTGAEGTYSGSGPGTGINVSANLTPGNFNPLEGTNLENYFFAGGTISGVGIIEGHSTGSETGALLTAVTDLVGNISTTVAQVYQPQMSTSLTNDLAPTEKALETLFSNSTPVSSTGSSDGSNSETTVLPDTISHNYTNVIPGVSVRVIDSGVNLHEE